MSRIQRLALKLVPVLLASSALASCGSGSSSAVQTQPPLVVTTAQESKFGGAFGTDFRAVANSEPATVADGDIVPVDLTTEPIPIT